MGVRREAKHGGGGSQPEERHGLAAEIHRIDRQQKKHGTEGFCIVIFEPVIFVE
jgi:hypothetical protein